MYLFIFLFYYISVEKIPKTLKYRFRLGYIRKFAKLLGHICNFPKVKSWGLNYNDMTICVLLPMGMFNLIPGAIS